MEANERAELEPGTAVPRCAPPVSLAGLIVVVVDDGIATGSTARAACQVARARAAARVVLAVPVAPPESVATLSRDADEMVCIEMPTRFLSASVSSTRTSPPTSDGEVVALLERATLRPAAMTVPSTASGDRHPSGEADPPLRDEDVEVPFGPGRAGSRDT